jgi:hypothetical protein
MPYGPNLVPSMARINKNHLRKTSRGKEEKKEKKKRAHT